jgi:hypothetical protein
VEGKERKQKLKKSENLSGTPYRNFADSKEKNNQDERTLHGMSDEEIHSALADEFVWRAYRIIGKKRRGFSCPYHLFVIPSAFLACFRPCGVGKSSVSHARFQPHAVPPLSEVLTGSAEVPVDISVKASVLRSRVPTHSTVLATPEHMHQFTDSAPSSSTGKLFRNFWSGTVFPS